jgi:hypothetical protein
MARGLLGEWREGDGRREKEGEGRGGGRREEDG